MTPHGAVPRSVGRDRRGDPFGHTGLEETGDGSLPEKNGGKPVEPSPSDVIRLLRRIRRHLLEQWRRKPREVDPSRCLSQLSAIDLLTEQAELQREPAQAEPGLGEREAFRVVEQVAHDLRSPLTAILFLADTLRSGESGSITELQRHQLGLVYAAALALTRITDDLTTLALEQAPGPFADRAPFSLGETFEAVKNMVAPMMEVKRITGRFEVDCAEHRVGYPGPLGRVLLNLTTNAIKFSDEGGRVEVRAREVAPDTVELSVRDSGQGIPPERLEQLSRPIQRSAGQDRVLFSSSGLGLTIVRRLLKTMRSELELDSRVGYGTRFSFLLELPTLP
jgi:signal transduction histidine kinase